MAATRARASSAAPRSLAVLVTWSGAALFAASLLFFLYCYLVRYGIPARTGDAIAASAFDVVLFSIFALHHSLFARPRFKGMVRRVVPPELERSLYTWVASLLFIGVCAWWRPLPGVLYDIPDVWRFLAYAAQAAGIVLTVRASAKLDVLDLAGVRAVQLAFQPAGAIRHVPLETTGLYGFVRHPLYFAWALFVFAAPTMTATRALFAFVSTAYLAAAIPWEERSLIQTFGADYEAYRRKVRWRMVPWVY
jgi:methanethiol S-methyltransferase